MIIFTLRPGSRFFSSWGDSSTEAETCTRIRNGNIFIPLKLYTDFCMPCKTSFCWTARRLYSMRDQEMLQERALGVSSSVEHLYLRQFRPRFSVFRCQSYSLVTIKRLESDPSATYSPYSLTSTSLRPFTRYWRQHTPFHLIL